MIPKAHRASVFFIATDLRYLGSVAQMVTTLSEVCLLLCEAQNLKLPVAIEGKLRQRICRTCFAGKYVSSFVADTRCSVEFWMLSKTLQTSECVGAYCNVWREAVVDNK